MITTFLSSGLQTNKTVFQRSNNRTKTPKPTAYKLEFTIQGTKPSLSVWKKYWNLLIKEKDSNQSSWEITMKKVGKYQKFFDSSKTVALPIIYILPLCNIFVLQRSCYFQPLPRRSSRKRSEGKSQTPALHREPVAACGSGRKAARVLPKSADCVQPHGWQWPHGKSAEFFH